MPGYQALINPSVPVGESANRPQKTKPGVRKIIDHYLRMNKVLVGPSGALTLSHMANEIASRGGQHLTSFYVRERLDAVRS